MADLEVVPPAPIALTLEPTIVVDLEVTTPAVIELEVATVGIPGAPGQPGPPGTGGQDLHAVHVQTTPAAEWTWTHGLGRRTMPTLFLDAPNGDPSEPVWTDITFADDNTLIVTWPTPVAGRIYL